jgi:hypothetical protein
MVEIRVGYELIYDCPQPTPMMLMLNIHYTRASDILVPDHVKTDPSVPIRAIWPTNSQMNEAMKNPMPSPHCIIPAPLPRERSGHSSAIMEVPVDHSEPIAMPTRTAK